MNTQTPCPCLESASLILRPVQVADVATLFTLWTQEGSAADGGFDPLTDPAELAGSIAYFERMNVAGTFYKWLIIDRATSLPIGECELFPLKAQFRPWVEFSIGFLLARGQWGRGRMSEAVRRLLVYAFVERDIPRIKADVLPHNLRSCHLLERVGFRREGLQAGKVWQGGTARDAWLYGLTRTQYLVASGGTPGQGARRAAR